MKKKGELYYEVKILGGNGYKIYTGTLNNDVDTKNTFDSDFAFGTTVIKIPDRLYSGLSNPHCTGYSRTCEGQCVCRRLSSA